MYVKLTLIGLSIITAANSESGLDLSFGSEIGGGGGRRTFNEKHGGDMGGGGKQVYRKNVNLGVDSGGVRVGKIERGGGTGGGGKTI